MNAHSYYFWPPARQQEVRGLRLPALSRFEGLRPAFSTDIR
jgi:hypothetical protein